MTKQRKPHSVPLRIVGVGASAGGLDALKQLLGAIPAEAGIAVVIMQHLAPSQTGVLRKVLAGSTTMPILDLGTGVRPRRDHVYIVPPHADVVLLRGALVLRVAKAKRTLLPIDAMLRSFASVLRERSVGVVLSGTGNDGSEGARAIRAVGGTTFVQDPATAQFDEMPRSAIAGGGATAVLAATDIGVALGALASPSATGLVRVIEILRDATGVDFTDYKRPTIERRVARRMREVGDTSPEAYTERLLTTPSEAATLSEDLLIHVTEFFRELATLDVLVAKVFSAIVANLGEGDTIRVWVPACSTGQEAYSLAILLLEFLEAGKHRHDIQIFGTDLSEPSIEVARVGWYPATITDRVSPERLEQFFARSDGGWRVKKALRERCVFVRHDLVADPPFAKLDLVSCRNLLIYLGTHLQQVVVPMLHYSLNQPGFLVLGRAESIVGFDHLFAPLEPTIPIFVRQPTAGRSPIRFARGRTPVTFDRPPPDRSGSALQIQRAVDHVLLARYAPACILIDADGEIGQFRGRTGRFLEPPSGLPSHNVFRMARGGLGREIRAGLARAQREDRAIRCEDVTLREDGRTRRVHIEVLPVPSMIPQRHFVVVFEDAIEVKRIPAPRRGRRAVANPLEHELQQELATAREYLQSTIAQHAATSEELEIANEELQSTNEELQSTNEELQTAKEELQSTNEELETVVEELRSGNERLAVMNDDLVNVLASIEIAIVIVGIELEIRRFTPSARAIMNLLPGDVGRLISDLQPFVELRDLDRDIRRVIETLATHEVEVAGAAGTWYRLQIRPYRTQDNKIDGAVISFVDITALRRSIDQARATRDYAKAIVDTVPSPLVVLGADRRIESANRAFFALLGTLPAQAVGQPLASFGPGRWLEPGAAALGRALATGGSFDDIEVERETIDDHRTLLIGARVFDQVPPFERLLLVGMLDITDRIRADQARMLAKQIAREKAEASEREKDSFLNAVSHELRTPLNAILLWTDLLRRGDLDPDQHRQAVATIEESARIEARLVDDLLDLTRSRDPDRELAIALEHFDPTPIIATALDGVRADAASKRIAVERHFAADLRVHADPRRLHQIVWNLAMNAIKFTPAGGHVHVTLRRRAGDVELRIDDDGKGIGRELLPRVFEPFWQQDQSSTRSEQGLGIGLALVRHLVERQHGTIRVDSDGDGTGATFTVLLPFSE